MTFPRNSLAIDARDAELCGWPYLQRLIYPLLAPGRLKSSSRG